MTHIIFPPPLFVFGVMCLLTAVGWDESSKLLERDKHQVVYMGELPAGEGKKHTVAFQKASLDLKRRPSGFAVLFLFKNSLCLQITI